MHIALCNALDNTAVNASLGPSREGKFRFTGDDRQPADVLVPHWTRELDTAWYVTVVNPLQAVTVAGAAASPAHALEVPVQQKNWGALVDCQGQGIKFITLARAGSGGDQEAGYSPG